MISPARRTFHRWLLASGLMLSLALPTLRAATGDLVPICMNSDGNDDFALIALATIPAGTRLFIADNGWGTAANTLIQEGASPSPSRQIQLDVGAGGIPLGTVLKFDQSGTNVVMTPALGTITMADRFGASGTLATKLSFSSGGDQILIWQTAGGVPTATVTMVSALNISAVTGANLTITNGFQVGMLPQAGQTAATTECNPPAGLIVYDGSNASTATAFGLGTLTVSGVTAQDNYKYNGPYGLADKAAYLAAINNPANWVANDTVPYDLSGVGPGPGAAEINLQGNATNIVDGATTPLAADHTLFGSVPVSSGTIARTFTIQNVGTANLTIPAAGITLSGTNAAEFVVSGISLPAVIAQNTSQTFTVTFDPSAIGNRAATVNIVNDDSNENPYNFNIQGYGFNYTPPAGAPPSSRWSSTVQNTNAGATRCVNATASGDIIAGSRINSGTTANLRITRHAAGTGAVTSTREYDAGTSEDINGMITDPANGDTYIASRASVGGGLNWFVHKVNGDGSHGWTYTFDSGATFNDEVFALTRASDGNVVAVGMITTASGSFARAARINAATGAEMNSYTSPTNLSRFVAVAADASGNVFATGNISDVNVNGLTVKLNATLGLVWSQTFDGAAALADSFSNVVALSNGDCAVGGTSRTSATNSDALVIRYAAASPGTQVWRRDITGAAGVGNETLNHLYLEVTGDLYVAGSMANVSSSDRDAYVMKITGSSGAIAWTSTRLGSGADGTDRFQNVGVSGSAVYAVGTAENANRDILASRFNASTGAEEWTFTFNGSGNGADDVFSVRNVMAVLGTDAIAIGGETFDVSGNTYGFVKKYAVVAPPTLTNVAKSVNEDAIMSFAAADFTAAYTDTNGLALTTVRITSLPANGLLKNGAVTIAAVPADIAIGSIASLSYTPNANFNGSDSFGWNGSNGTLYATSPATVNLTVNPVNDTPALAGIEAAALPYIENQAATPISATLTVADVDGSLASATVSMTGNYANGQDVLAFAPQLGITGTFVPATGVLTLSGATTAANYQTALRAVTYANTSETPSILARTVSIQVNDGAATGNLSNIVTRGITVSSVNDNPTPGPDIILRNAGASAKVLESGLLANDSDLDGDTPLTITGVNTPSPNGATITRSGGYVFYLPAAGFSGTDTFTYVLSDGKGGTANGTVTMNITANPDTSSNTTSITQEPAPGGGTQTRVRFAGIPGRAYQIQTTDSLSPANWTTRATVTANAQGVFEYVDPPPLPAQRFYRTIFP